MRSFEFVFRSPSLAKVFYFRDVKMMLFHIIMDTLAHLISILLVFEWRL